MYVKGCALVPLTEIFKVCLVTDLKNCLNSIKLKKKRQKEKEKKMANENVAATCPE
jgi:hypothetical protein